MFLQDGIDGGLSLSTIKVQIVALSVYLDPYRKDLLLSRFCKAITKFRPVQGHKTPSWDLSVVLGVFLGIPFEPISEASLSLLTLKTVLLVAITSAHRMSEMQVLSTRDPFLQILDDGVILKTDPGFVLKLVSKFHKSQDIILPTFFCQNASNDKEKECHGGC